MNSHIYIDIASYLWSNEISHLYSFSKSNPDLHDLYIYLSARIVSRSIKYLVQDRYEKKWLSQFGDEYYGYYEYDYRDRF
jgi:hypothetical protein